MKRTRAIGLSLLLISFLGISVVSVVHVILHYSQKAETYVYVSAPSPMPSAPLIPMQSIRHSFGGSYSATNTSSAYMRPATITSSVTSAPLVRLSDADVHTIGLGSAVAPAASMTSTTTRHQSAAPSASVTMPVTTSLYALASTRPVASPGATEAPQMARIQAEPRHAPGPPDIPGDLPIDKQLPIGSPLTLILFLGLYMLIRKKQQKTIKMRA